MRGRRGFPAETTGYQDGFLRYDEDRSKQLSKLLRHKAHRRLVNIRKDGFAPMPQVTKALGWTDEEVEEIVNASISRGGNRFEIQRTLAGAWIRAKGGHSIHGIDNSLVMAPADLRSLEDVAAITFDGQGVALPPPPPPPPMPPPPLAATAAAESGRPRAEVGGASGAGHGGSPSGYPTTPGADGKAEDPNAATKPQGEPLASVESTVAVAVAKAGPNVDLMDEVKMLRAEILALKANHAKQIEELQEKISLEDVVKSRDEEIKKLREELAWARSCGFVRPVEEERSQQRSPATEKAAIVLRTCSEGDPADVLLAVTAGDEVLGVTQDQEQPGWIYARKGEKWGWIPEDAVRSLPAPSQIAGRSFGEKIFEADL